ncbi:MAG: AAA family ATPase [Treponema sp.]|nr:AAA family ATPase [Treponema sp.]
MIEVETRVKIPFLWGKAVFKKSNWSQINLIVGPNGSGKTLLAQRLASQFEEAGYSVRFIKSERGGYQEQMEQMALLRNNEKIRTKIERVLSSMFGKSIKFIEDIDGSLIPIVENRAWNVEYMLEQVECHGLREIISLLISLYSKTAEGGAAGECVIFDEPELHLHPQFQTFFINEIRKEVQHTSRRVFFLISHSPFFIDLRTPEDLIGVIACHINQVPTSIEELTDEDDALFRRFLPRFNTYHKQFFFSDNQIFVEGYTDQQIFTNLLPFIEDDYKAAGTGIIDVGGKDELGVFCKVCALLGTNSRIITDLDSLFSGKLRDVACKDERVKSWMEKQNERQKTFYESIFTAKEIQSEITLEKLIYKLERLLAETGQEIRKDEFQKAIRKRFASQKTGKQILDEFNLFISKLDALQEKHDNADAVDTYKTVLLQGINRLGNEMEEDLAPKTRANITKIKNLAAFILAAMEAARVYILHRGCIEHYYTRSDIRYMPVSAKDRLFRTELEFIQDSHKKTVRKNFTELIELLEKACS